MLLNHRRAGFLFSKSDYASSDLRVDHSPHRSPSARSEPWTRRERTSLPPTNSDLVSLQAARELRVVSKTCPIEFSEASGGRESQYSQHGEDLVQGGGNNGGDPAEASDLPIQLSIAQEQRKLIRLTDKILLRRTQVQHQQQTVANCRRFFDSSLKDVNAAVQARRSQHEQQRLDRKVRRSRKDRRGVGFESFVHIAEPSAISIEDNGDFWLAPENPSQLDESQVRIMEAPPDFETAHEQYDIDSRALTTQEQKLNDMMDELSTLEYEVAQLHRRFSERLRTVGFAKELQTSLASVDLEPTGSSRRTSKASTETPSLVTQYFDQKGDSGVYRERLEELEYDFHEGLLERGMITERGDSLDVSDADFEATYNARRQIIREEIQAAEDKAAELAQECLTEGLDIEKYRKAKRSVRAVSTVGRQSSHLGSLGGLDDAPELEMSPAAQDRASSKVTSWLRRADLTAGKQEPSETSTVHE